MSHMYPPCINSNDHGKATPDPDDLLRAAHELARLVRMEYPDGYSLAGIAGIWDGADLETEGALDRVEDWL
jgi:hypothetical protein